VKRVFELTLGEFFIAEAQTWRGINVARHHISQEMHLRADKLTIHYPPNYEFPTVGGGMMSARDLGLPLSEED
jgi:hypothetical protein